MDRCNGSTGGYKFISYYGAFIKLRKLSNWKPNKHDKNSPKGLANEACQRSLINGGFRTFKIEFEKLLRLYRPDNTVDNIFIGTVVEACEYIHKCLCFEDFQWLIYKIKDPGGLLKLVGELCELGLTVYCEYILLSVFDQFENRDYSGLVYYAVESYGFRTVSFVCKLSINKPEMGIDINKRSGADNFTPFMKAISSDKYGLIPVLKQHGCEVKFCGENEKLFFSWEELFPYVIGQKFKHGYVPQSHTRGNFLSCLRKLIDSGIDLGLSDVNGNTLLELALEKQESDFMFQFVNFLLRTNFPISDKCYVLLNKYYLPRKQWQHNGTDHYEFHKLNIIYLVSLFTLKLNFVNGLDAILSCKYSTKPCFQNKSMDQLIEEFNSLPSLFRNMTLKERCRLKIRFTLGVRVNFVASMENLGLPGSLLEYIVKIPQ